LWTHGRPVEWNEDIVSVDGLVITDEDIAAADGSEARFTSDNFRVYESSRYGWTFARQGHDSNVHDRIAELIRSADESIWIASGHMRSRPISEAVLEARAANPDLDVRVYLDGQEYTSAWYSNQELGDHEDCLDAALDADDVEDCNEDGMYWGYPLHAAGVPIRFKWSAYRWDYRYAEQMHHKLVIVDGDTVATGSYNYSPNAEFDTFENLIVLERERYPQVLDGYVARYEELWETRRDEVDGFLDELAFGTSDVEIVFAGMAMDYDEIDLAKDLIQDACPDVDSDDFRENPSHHYTCERQ
jgi:phosphatidylserine/phosphatidylglycerophosphate/cardiolipin synthase-like enzyme